jgi:hypothetical protein
MAWYNIGSAHRPQTSLILDRIKKARGGEATGLQEISVSI